MGKYILLGALGLSVHYLVASYISWDWNYISDIGKWPSCARVFYLGSVIASVVTPISVSFQLEQ